MQSKQKNVKNVKFSRYIGTDITFLEDVNKLYVTVIVTLQKPNKKYQKLILFLVIWKLQWESRSKSTLPKWFCSIFSLWKKAYRFRLWYSSTSLTQMQKQVKYANIFEIFPDESNIKNIYGKLSRTATYLESKPWHKILTERKPGAILILAFSFSKSLISDSCLRFLFKPITIMVDLAVVSPWEFWVAQLILKVLISFWDAIFSYYQTTFSTWSNFRMYSLV